MLCKQDLIKTVKVLAIKPFINLLPLVYMTIFSLFFTYSSLAQSDSTSNIFLGGLDDLKNLSPDVSLAEDISVASSFGSDIYEAPGVISIITDEDIKNSGYRDILDVLNQIPGFSLAADVQNGISFGIRGNWAEEAKLLVMLDGMPLNEMSYGTFIFGHRIPLINIKRIEIIRGAGSSKYGGVGALGVINIVTKAASDISGHRITTSNGLSQGKYNRTNLAYNYGAVMPNKVEITTMGMINQGKVSNERCELPDSAKVNFADSSYVAGVRLYLTAKYKGLVFRQYYEDYYFQSTFEPIFSLNRNSISEAEKTFPFKRFDLSFKGGYKFQIPWNTLYGDPNTYDAQNLLTDRANGSMFLKTKFSIPFQFITGVYYNRDNFRHQRASKLLTSGKRKEINQGISWFGEGVYDSKYFNVNAGVRIEQYAYFTPNIAPRFSIAKKFRYWNYKLIYNKAYKIPALQNINLDSNKTMVPENITEMQAQIGFQLKNFNFFATGFQTTIQNLIVYGYNLTTLQESYINSGSISTAGLELEAGYTFKRFKFNANYSWYMVQNSTVPEVLIDTLNVGAGTLALPINKVAARLTYNLNSNITLNAQYVFESLKYGFVRVNRTSDEYDLVEFPATHNLNVIAEYKGLYKGFADVSLGFYNVLGTKLSYLYPFNSGYQPLMGMGREIMLCLKLKL